MKRLILIFATLLLFATSLQAQSHKAILTWVLSTDDTLAACSLSTSTCIQNIYAASGACSQTAPVFKLLSSQPATVTTYTDYTITSGTWCYAVTFSLNGLESAKATVQVSLSIAVTPTSPSALVIVVT